MYDILEAKVCLDFMYCCRVVGLEHRVYVFDDGLHV